VITPYTTAASRHLDSERALPHLQGSE